MRAARSDEQNDAIPPGGFFGVPDPEAPERAEGAPGNSSTREAPPEGASANPIRARAGRERRLAERRLPRSWDFSLAFRDRRQADRRADLRTRVERGDSDAIEEARFDATGKTSPSEGERSFQLSLAMQRGEMTGRLRARDRLMVEDIERAVLENEAEPNLFPATGHSPPAVEPRPSEVKPAPPKKEKEDTRRRPPLERKTHLAGTAPDGSPICLWCQQGTCPHLHHLRSKDLWSRAAHAHEMVLVREQEKDLKEAVTWATLEGTYRAGASVLDALRTIMEDLNR